MTRMVEHCFGRPLLGDAGGIHDDDAVGVTGDHAEIVSDDDQRDVELARQILHQFENLRLNGDVERRGRLVRDDELRIAGQSDRDHHALAHAAGKLMRILVEPAHRVGDADQLHQFDGARRRFLVGHAEMDLQRFLDLQADREDRIQRGHRLLKDHRDVATANLAHLLVVEVEQGSAVEHDPAFRDFPGKPWQQPHDRERRYRLAGPGLADDGDHLAAVDGEADALDGAHDAPRGAELGVQVVDFEERRSRLRPRVPQCAQIVTRLGNAQPWSPSKAHRRRRIRHPPSLLARTTRDRQKSGVVSSLPFPGTLQRLGMPAVLFDYAAGRTGILLTTIGQGKIFAAVRMITRWRPGAGQFHLIAAVVTAGGTTYSICTLLRSASLRACNQPGNHIAIAGKISTRTTQRTWMTMKSAMPR